MTGHPETHLEAKKDGWLRPVARRMVETKGFLRLKHHLIFFCKCNFISCPFSLVEKGFSHKLWGRKGPFSFLLKERRVWRYGRKG